MKGILDILSFFLICLKRLNEAIFWDGGSTWMAMVKIDADHAVGVRLACPT
jgi:hypothetical protein